MFLVIQSSWTLREAMTKKGRCSVFRQRPFDVFATTGCCRGLSAITLRHFTGTIVERDYLMLTAFFAMFCNLRKGSATVCVQ